MKKFSIIFTSILVVCFIVYISISNHSQASDNSPAFEYYYNDNSIGEDVVTMHTIDPETKTNDNSFYPQTMDTEQTSMTVFINKEYCLSEDYIPDDLVVPNILFQFSAYSEKKLMRKEPADALEELFSAAKDEGLSLYGVSGYRSYKRQKEIYESNIRKKGIIYTNKYSAKPGYSEHQSGLSIDVSTPSINYKLEAVFAGTPEGKWLAENSYKYGFIIRYPEGKYELTGYSYEPWHIRYVGKDLAVKLYENNLTLEEYYGYIPPDGLFDSENDNYVIDVEEVPEETTPPESIKPSMTPEPSATPSPKPSATPKPTKRPVEEKPTETPIVPEETQTPEIPEETIEPSETPEPDDTVIPSPTPEVSETQIPGDNTENTH